MHFIRPPEMLFFLPLYVSLLSGSELTHTLSTKSYLSVPGNPAKSVYMGQLSTLL